MTKKALPLGTTKSGTLSIEDEPDGVYFFINLPTSRYDVFESVQRGDLSECSFSFSVSPGGESWDFSKSPAVRTLKKITVTELTLTSTGAYNETIAETTRSYEAAESKELDRLIPDELADLVSINKAKLKLFKLGGK